MGKTTHHTAIEIFQFEYNTVKVPEEWEKTIICLIFKNKEDKLRCENCRQIFQMNHAAKLYESILEKRLRRRVEAQFSP